MTFESHWASEHFEAYDPAVNGEASSEALREHDRRSLGEASTISFAELDVHPYPHQQRMLEALTVERERHDRHRNLVVAATGTGKTVVAALDYRQLREPHGGELSLLFVAHREEILAPVAGDVPRTCCATAPSARSTAAGSRGGRARLRDGPVASGRTARADSRPTRSTSSSSTSSTTQRRRPTTACSSTSQPTELLGLTATPERLDGKDVTEWFDDRIAVELRLWEAIDQGFLVPFQYFGVADGTDLSGSLAARRIRAEELSNVLTGNDLRVAKLLEAIERIVLDLGAMRALGFCVSKEHAHYMARKFTEAGLAERRAHRRRRADRSSAASLRELQARRAALHLLGRGSRRGSRRSRRRQLLLLRPTDSADGLHSAARPRPAPADGKSHLTVIDLIGQHRREFRFEDRLSAIVDAGADRCATRSRTASRSCPPAARRPRPSEPRDRSRQPQGGRARSRWATLVERSAREPTVTSRSPSSSSSHGSARGRLPRDSVDPAAPRRRSRAGRGERPELEERSAEGARPADPRRRSRAGRASTEAARGAGAAATSGASTSATSGC